MLEHPDQKFFQGGLGYAELGLFAEANEQVEKIHPFNRAAPEVLALLLEIYRGLQKWELMAKTAKILTELQPDHVEWSLLLAYATHKFDSIESAKQILLAAESRFSNDPSIKFDLAAYEFLTGNLEQAKAYLKQCFTVDPHFSPISYEIPSN